MMNKKKIVTGCLAAAMLVTALIGGSLAYFTDIDTQDNVFISGKVDISLEENFEQNSKLVPATGSVQNGTLKNGVTKEIAVKAGENSEATFVRVHIAIPAILDDGAEDFDAGEKILYFNYTKDSIGEGLWDWSKTAGEPYEGNWNAYQTMIDGIKYNVYVVTYGTALKAGETTSKYAMHQVYLDSKVTNADIDKINKALGNDWEIKVIAEGVQEAGFNDAYVALNTAFGIPGAEGYTDPWH